MQRLSEDTDSTIKIGTTVGHDHHFGRRFNYRPHDLPRNSHHFENIAESYR